MDNLTAVVLKDGKTLIIGYRDELGLALGNRLLDYIVINDKQENSLLGLLDLAVSESPDIHSMMSISSRHSGNPIFIPYDNIAFSVKPNKIWIEKFEDEV